MKRFLFLPCLLFIASAWGQDNQVKLNDLYIPTAPGFVLADKAPSSVEKPVTPRAFGISLLNLWQGGAVDVTPFWFSNKPRYTFEEWYKKRFTFVETFNLSVASFKTDTSSHVSAGFRSQIFRVYSEKGQAALKAQEDTIIALLVPTDDAGNPKPLDEPAIQKALKKLDELRQKGLFSLEVAGAILGAATNNSFKQLSTAKSGVWANIRWSPVQGMVNLVGLTRYAWAPGKSKSGKDSAFLDWGASLNIQKANFDLSFEYVRRHDISGKAGYDRVAFVTNYVINENIVLVASLGKNFSKVDNIVTVFGIKFGLSRQAQKL